MTETSQKRISLITGASTGIGKAIALKFAKQGNHLILLGRSLSKLKTTLSEIVNLGGSGEIIETDLSEIDSINLAIHKIKSTYDNIDFIFNVAGIWHGEDVVYAGIDFERFDQKIILDTYTVGLVAPTILVHGLLPMMNAGSNIVNISGTFESGAKGWLPYYVSKKGIEDLTIGLSEELKDRGIKVNCISPSDTATENYAKYFPQYLDDSITPEKVADEVAKIVIENISGEIRVVRN